MKKYKVTYHFSNGDIIEDELEDKDFNINDFLDLMEEGKCFSIGIKNGFYIIDPKKVEHVNIAKIIDDIEETEVSAEDILKDWKRGR